MGATAGLRPTDAAPAPARGGSGPGPPREPTRRRGCPGECRLVIGQSEVRSPGGPVRGCAERRRGREPGLSHSLRRGQPDRLADPSGLAPRCALGALGVSRQEVAPHTMTSAPPRGAIESQRLPACSSHLTRTVTRSQRSATSARPDVHHSRRRRKDGARLAGGPAERAASRPLVRRRWSTTMTTAEPATESVSPGSSAAVSSSTAGLARSSLPL